MSLNGRPLQPFLKRCWVRRWYSRGTGATQRLTLLASSGNSTCSLKVSSLPAIKLPPQHHHSPSPSPARCLTKKLGWLVHHIRDRSNWRGRDLLEVCPSRFIGPAPPLALVSTSGGAGGGGEKKGGKTRLGMQAHNMRQELIGTVVGVDDTAPVLLVCDGESGQHAWVSISDLTFTGTTLNSQLNSGGKCPVPR